MLLLLALPSVRLARSQSKPTVVGPDYLCSNAVLHKKLVLSVSPVRAFMRPVRHINPDGRILLFNVGSSLSLKRSMKD